MYKQLFKNKVKHKQKAHYISVDLEINRYFARKKSIAIARKMYLRLLFLTFARITCYLEYI